MDLAQQYCCIPPFSPLSFLLNAAVVVDHCQFEACRAEADSTTVYGHFVHCSQQSCTITHVHHCTNMHAHVLNNYLTIKSDIAIGPEILCECTRISKEVTCKLARYQCKHTSVLCSTSECLCTPCVSCAWSSLVMRSSCKSSLTTLRSDSRTSALLHHSCNTNERLHYLTGRL